MQRNGKRLDSGRPAWQTVLLLLTCVLLHYLALRGFLGVNSTIDPRVFASRTPFQVELVADPVPARPPPPPPAQPPKPAPRVVRPPVERPRPRPAPAPEPVVAGPEPITESTVPEPQATVNDTALNTTDAGTPQLAPPVEPVASATPPPPPAEPAAPEPKPPVLIYGEPLPAPPPAGRWTYSVHIGQYFNTGEAAQLKLNFEHDAQRYRLSAEVSATGLTAFFYSGVRKDFSEGRITANGLEPHRYAEQRNRRPERAATVDYSAGRIVLAGGESRALPPGVQDRLSGLFQLGLLARGSPHRFGHGAIVEMPEFSLGSVDRVRYRVDGVVPLETHLGVLRTLQLTRLTSGQGDEPQVEVWLDYDFWMLPVRIRLTEGARIIDQLIEKKGP